MKPKLKAPRTKRLKLSYDVPPSNFACKFNLRRYSQSADPIHAFHGRAVQDDPIKPMLKAPGTKEH